MMYHLYMWTFFTTVLIVLKATAKVIPDDSRNMWFFLFMIPMALISMTGAFASAVWFILASVKHVFG